MDFMPAERPDLLSATVRGVVLDLWIIGVVRIRSGRGLYAVRLGKGLPESNFIEVEQRVAFRQSMLRSWGFHSFLQIKG